ncbi:hypothetical protein [Pontibacter mangrovi]|uniref:Uncharacterized protein n=1 Tax=Pontibacter mangrovi TaxID=2589816 RepID=A0A501W2M0_9BACT|nr:hypothetical protein [Pontibacter mangrovi]TPE43518.1 hypothetical protein FJM65_12230 [Pontibacter mangrovi]
MPGQRESNINDFAFDYLCSHYTTNFGAKHLLVEKAVYTRQGHAADGLFSFKKEEDGPFVAALHTANSSKIAAALTRYKKKGLGITRFLSAGLVLVLTGLAVWQLLGQLVTGAVAAVAVAALTFVVHTYLERKYHFSKITSYLNELKRLPANEQWLGISVSSLTFRHNPLAKHLLSVCERRGIGVITVGKRAKVVLMQEPRTLSCRGGDFLSHYQSGDRIRKTLTGDNVLRVA